MHLPLNIHRDKTPSQLRGKLRKRKKSSDLNIEEVKRKVGTKEQKAEWKNENLN
jgi:hypothetical protein